MKIQTASDADAAAGAASASLKATLSGAGMMSIGGITESQVAMIGGLLLGVLGLLLQWHYQRKRDRREEREHEARMSELEP